MDPQPVSMSDTKVSAEPAQGNGRNADKKGQVSCSTVFQCSGFGDCRMVFTRSEHLARHVRCVVS